MNIDNQLQCNLVNLSVFILH